MKEDGKARSVWLRILGYFLMGMLLFLHFVFDN